MEVNRQINVATRIAFPIVDADGDTVTAAAALDSESSTWADGTNPTAFADLTNEATEIGTTGIYYLILTAAEMNFAYIAVQVKTTTTGAKTQHILINTSFAPRSDASSRTDVGTWLGVAPNALVTGRVDASVGAMAADVVTAAAIAAGAIDAATFAAGAIDNAAFNVTETLTANPATGGIVAASFAAGAIDAAAIGTDAIDADSLAASASVEIRSLASGTADSGTTTTMVDAARTEADTDYWKGQIIVFTSGTLLGQARLITDFAPVTDTITFTPATTVAVLTHTYEIWPGGTIDVRQWAGVTPNALVSGRVDGSVGAMATGVITAAAHAAGAIDAAAIATGAIDADAIAADAIGASELAADAVDEIWDEAMVEQAQGIPAAAPAFRTVLAYLYMALRNRLQITNTEKRFTNDALTVVWKKVLSDDGTTYAEEEGVSGP